MPSSASMTFEGKIAGKRREITIDLTVEGEQPITVVQMREILVQVAVKLTNESELASLAAQMATPGAESAAPTPPKPQAELAPPLLRTKLKRLK
jgi:hypothetical protein